MANRRWGEVEGTGECHYFEGVVKTGYTPACDFVVSVPKIDLKSRSRKCGACFAIALVEDEIKSAK